MTARPSQMSQDVAHAANLLAHPLGGMAAASAMALGAATQAWGLWFGALAGAMESAGRLARAAPVAGNDAAADDETLAAVKARAANVSVMADARVRRRKPAAAAGTKAAEAGSARPAARSGSVASFAKAKAGASARRAVLAKRDDLPDDLKAISGIGPKLEQVLNAMGVSTYAQIAAWTPRQASDIEAKLGLSGRIGRDDWIGQAARLAGASGKQA